jgi:AAA15 family ATPase/GTPase
MEIDLQYVTAFSSEALGVEQFEFSESRDNTIENLKHINVIIGANNSGKSRLLRAIFSSQLDNFDYQKKFASKAQTDLRNYKPTIEDIDQNVYKELNNLLRDNKSTFDSNIRTRLENQIESIFNINGKYPHSSDINSYALTIFSKNNWDEFYKFRRTKSFDLNSVRKEYIPILRGFRTLVPETDVYLDRTLKDYFSSDISYDSINIFTGHTLYKDIDYAKAGSDEEQQSVFDYENYLSEHFFQGKSVRITPRKVRDNKDNSNNVVSIKIGQESQYPIYELGDGIQSIIALTVRPFLQKEPSIFFIEEPEQNLHAGMQRALIEAFRACPQHKFFFTTQSNHFVDLTLESDDINLISVKKEVDGTGKATSIVQSQASNNRVLKELGVLASSVLLANCSIWVEGVTDKRYLQVYLAKFLEELKQLSVSDGASFEERHEAKMRLAKLSTYNENLHYVFVEYQGSNITHWAFTDAVNPDESSQTPAQRLSKDVLLIADADIDSKGSRVEDLQKALGKRFELLKWKEIENYIPQEVIVKAAKKHWDNFQHTDGASYSFDDIPDKYFENPEIGIGGLLEDKVSRSKASTKAKDSYFYRAGAPTKMVGKEVVDCKSSGSTIRIKVEFCDTVVNIMKGKDEENEVDWQLTDELKDLCDRVWSFIEECNS